MIGIIFLKGVSKAKLQVFVHMLQHRLSLPLVVLTNLSMVRMMKRIWLSSSPVMVSWRFVPRSLEPVKGLRFVLKKALGHCLWQHWYACVVVRSLESGSRFSVPSVCKRQCCARCGVALSNHHPDSIAAVFHRSGVVCEYAPCHSVVELHFAFIEEYIACGVANAMAAIPNFMIRSGGEVRLHSSSEPLEFQQVTTHRWSGVLQLYLLHCRPTTAEVMYIGGGGGSRSVNFVLEAWHFQLAREISHAKSRGFL